MSDTNIIDLNIAKINASSDITIACLNSLDNVTAEMSVQHGNDFASFVCAIYEGIYKKITELDKNK